MVPPPKGPVDVKHAPPPPPKTASGPKTASRAAALAFMPTTLRTKRVSQVAGGVVQVSSSSLSLEKRKNLLFSEKPKVAEKVDMDDEFAAFMDEVGEEIV